MLDLANERDYCSRWNRGGALRYVLGAYSAGVYSVRQRDLMVRWVLSDRFGMPDRF